MIIRIVRMTFDPAKTDEFLQVFNHNKGSIRNFKGCTHLELHRDADNPDIFATYSYWEKADDLENYRQSELFKNVWSQTKTLFKDKAEAYTHERLMIVEPDENIRY